MKKHLFRASAEDFKKIPGSPIAYWLSPRVFEMFYKYEKLSAFCESGGRIKTHDNDTYMRLYWEVDRYKTNSESPSWNLYENGGETFKWFGNVINVVSWLPSSREFYQSHGGLTKEEFWKKEGITWNNIGKAGFRYKSVNTEFSSVSPTAFPRNPDLLYFIIGFLNTKFSFELISVINPSLSNTIGDIFKLPLSEEGVDSKKISLNVRYCVNLAQSDWDSYELSWDFSSLPLIQIARGQLSEVSETTPSNKPITSHSLSAVYAALRSHWLEMTLEMQRLEEENNRIFIEAYGLEDELTSEVPLEEITLTCNPHYRYSGDKTEEELEALLLADTMRELVSYAVGCMFGRYALDKPGLILANQGETIEDYYKKLQEPQIETNKHESKNQENISVDSCSLMVQPSFLADEDNVIPMLDGDWFSDDITERFKQFLKVAFGSEHYAENLRFVEESLNIRGRRNYSIRDYFLGEFYADHVKRYKKRPIYWLFSSPKGSFNALIYMHRYRADTASVVLNDYLREFRTKLTAHKNHLEAVSINASASQREKTKALKEIEKITKMITELEEYEREVLYPLATKQVEIDLDDGVKVNYPKFGSALKKVRGLEAKED